MRKGRLTGVGVGPGDPDLLTLKAVRAIERAEVIAFIGARGRASRARRIVADHIQPGTRELAFAMPMTGELDDTGPIYEVMAGWRESTAGARSWADLPAQAIKYIRRVEELVQCPVALVSTSPEREDTILVRDPFAG